MMAKITLRHDCSGVDWKVVPEILKSVGMAHYEPDAHRSAFEASHTTIFVYQENRLIGFGRAISDGVYQAAIYDCAVLSGFQGEGIGRVIMEFLLSQLSQCNILLYASPGKEAFYQKFGFRKMKTGMARFTKDLAMRDRGFTE